MTSVEHLREKLPTSLKRLADLAYNYWWTWTQERTSLFGNIDPEGWARCGHNPVEMLHSVSDLRLSQLASDPTYLHQLDALAHRFDRYMGEGDLWARRVAPNLSPQTPVAYFCAEFGIHESLPIYSGGLGVLAGDHLKSASDLGVPLVGVGLLYRQGYFRQRLDRSGWQKDYYIDNQFPRMPLELMCDGDGNPIVVDMDIRSRSVKIQIWRAMVGRVPLYLLDTDRDDNDPVDRWLTGHLYGGNQDTRLAQEIVLGIGGVRALVALGLDPAVYHLNEGHAAFCTLEVARREMEKGDRSFYDVEKIVRDRACFTTHTPVPAGHDAFSPDMMDSFFDSFWPQLGLSREEFLALGAKRAGDPWEPFGMTVLALRMTRSSNGVSKLHGEVSRQMWRSLYPDRDEHDVPIGHITNGVHAPTWTAPLMADLYDRYLGEDWRTRLVDPQMWAKVKDIPAAELWERHQLLKQRLIAFTRDRITQSRIRRGEPQDYIDTARRLLDRNTLTIGFARRFSRYKRAYLFMSDPERIKAILSNDDRPVQMVFAGKAHPADEEGKRIIQRVIEWQKNHPELYERIAFIEDYDIYTAQKLVQGVDVWLNNPRRPLEASGTSGQKVCYNGGINLSVLDGWWREGYKADENGKGINGWAIGEEIDSSDRDLQDRIDSGSLYRLLEEEIVPLYYDRDDTGIPHNWIETMKASIVTNAPLFNTDRMIADYVATAYAPDSTVSLDTVRSSVPA